ncbi:ABC transporter ATP-binding protein [Aureimonas ureilytica]|uniref:ABC transporter ATP-binding protein n=2 Tax=Aureimonas ureilytica TaxID=401562 RepID=UPI0003736629|nr:ABC transporter ATP-binding protein [Aureimonas ureilytica]
MTHPSRDGLHGTAVSIRSLTKTFQGAPALAGIDIEIPAGEILTLLGPSGCGKTTLLRIIAGLERPDGPDMVRFDGEDVSHVPIERRQVGMVFQSYALFPNMTVAENVAYGLKVRRVPEPEREREARRLMEVVGISDLANRRISQVSGGQRQRIALARALAIRPRILLLDEPLSALDAVLRERLRAEIGELLREVGITAVYVTHDQAEAMAIGDRIAVMEKGRISQIGAPRDIYQHPANPFVARFVGTMNRIDAAVANGALRAGDGETWLSMPRGGDDRATTVWFRPEALRPTAAAGPQIRARIAAASFLGPTQRLAVTIGGGTQTILVDLPASPPLAPGGIVELALDPADLFEYDRQA